MKTADVTLGVAIAHAPTAERRGALAELEARLKPSPPWVAYAGVARDTKREGCWPGFRKAFKQALTMDVTHLLILADDVMPTCDTSGFWEATRDVIAAVPDRPISLVNLGLKVMEEALQAGTHWIADDGGLFGGSMIWPTAVAVDFLHFERAYCPTFAPPHHDGRVAIYLRKLELVPWYTVPSLLDHRVDVPSLLGHSTRLGSRPRSAGMTAGADVGSIDWTVGVTSPLRRSSAFGAPTQRGLDYADQRLEQDPWRSQLRPIPGRLPGEDPPSLWHPTSSTRQA